jgi:predicted O-linked N-acetylglucosamine transferase (SPINDLY family)
MLGVTETIASSEKEYIEIAVKLGNNKRWREQIKNKIVANHGRLYDDLECVRALEKFFKEIL